MSYENIPSAAPSSMENDTTSETVQWGVMNVTGVTGGTMGLPTGPVTECASEQAALDYAEAHGGVPCSRLIVHTRWND